MDNNRLSQRPLNRNTENPAPRKAQATPAADRKPSDKQISGQQDPNQQFSNQRRPDQQLSNKRSSGQHPSHQRASSQRVPDQRVPDPRFSPRRLKRQALIRKIIAFIYSMTLAVYSFSYIMYEEYPSYFLFAVFLTTPIFTCYFFTTNHKGTPRNLSDRIKRILSSIYILVLPIALGYLAAYLGIKYNFFWGDEVIIIFFLNGLLGFLISIPLRIWNKSRDKKNQARMREAERAASGAPHLEAESASSHENSVASQHEASTLSQPDEHTPASPEGLPPDFHTYSRDRYHERINARRADQEAYHSSDQPPATYQQASLRDQQAPLRGHQAPLRGQQASTRAQQQAQMPKLRSRRSYRNPVAAVLHSILGALKRLNRQQAVGLIAVCCVALIGFGIFKGAGVSSSNADLTQDYGQSQVNAAGLITSLDELEPKTRKMAYEFMRRCEKEGLKVKVTETYRPQERQDELYEQGRTKPGQIVTWTKNSMHTQRKAFDICQNIKGREYSDESFFKRCAKIGREVGLEPGYYWSKQDKPHFQYPDTPTQNIADILSGKGN